MNNKENKWKIKKQREIVGNRNEGMWLVGQDGIWHQGSSKRNNAQMLELKEDLEPTKLNKQQALAKIGY